MNLLEIAKQEQDLLNDGIMSLVVYKKGRSWRCKELYCCDYTEGEGFQWCFEEESQRQEVLNIMEIDSNAIIINGYDSAYCQGSINHIYNSLKTAYNNNWGLLSNEKENILQEECTMPYLVRVFPKEFTIRYIIPEIVKYLKSQNIQGMSMIEYYESEIAEYSYCIDNYYKDDYNQWLEETGELSRYMFEGEEYIQLVENLEETQEVESTQEENTQEVESIKKEVKKMERYSNSIGCHARYDNCTNEELKQIYNELNENDDDLIREVFYRIGWEYDKVFHIGEEDFNDNTLDIDKIVNNALNLL